MLTARRALVVLALLLGFGLVAAGPAQAEIIWASAPVAAAPIAKDPGHFSCHSGYICLADECAGLGCGAEFNVVLSVNEPRNTCIPIGQHFISVIFNLTGAGWRLYRTGRCDGSTLTIAANSIRTTDADSLPPAWANNIVAVSRMAIN
jgi:hypothetical protein